MNKSEQLGELFTALSKFQGELENATKNAVNPGVKNKYADLAECINTAKPVLAANGLAVVQLIGTQDGKQTLSTVMTHSSGQFISSEFVMADAVLMGGAGKNPVQALGSTITYQRRYAFAAITGMAQEDDDGNANTRNNKQANNARPTNADKSWIDAIKNGVATLEEINDINYKNKIQNFLKQGL